MNSDYLWDRSGHPDPEVEELEQALSRFRYPGGTTARQQPSPLAGSEESNTSWRGLSTLAAGILVAATAIWFTSQSHFKSWRVTYLSVDATHDRLKVGETLETHGQVVRIQVADIGSVEVFPQSRIRLTNTGPLEHRIELDRGKLHASIYAPPRLFVVGTPAATAVDLGCIYDLEVDDDGSGRLTVQHGYVELQSSFGLAYVPSDASCEIFPDIGPGVPFFEDAPLSLRTVDANDASGVRAALRDARERDTLTLWNLLPRVDLELRREVLTRIETLGDPLNAEISRESVLALEPDGLNAWRDILDLYYW